MVAGAGVVAAVLGVVIWLALDLLPPQRVSFAAGARDGGYWRIASRYADILARDGITLELRETAGSVENAALLEAGAVDVGLLQGGVSVEGDHLGALAAVFFEPLMLFHPVGAAPAEPPAAWAGLRIAAGPPGSGSRAAFEQLAAAAAIDPGANEALPLGGADAAAALLAGDADLALFVAPLQAPYLAPLLASDRVALLSFAYAEAIARRIPGARAVPAPAGVIAMAPPQPPEATTLVMLTARLVADDGLHPAAVDRLLAAAREVHGGRGPFHDFGRFPAEDGVDMRMNEDAEAMLEQGPSGLRGVLPYWAVAQISRVLALLIPLLVLLLPLLRALPGVYAWSQRRRIWRRYNAIGAVEAEVVSADAPRLRELDAELAGLDADLSQLSLPAAYRNAAFNARMHIELVRRRIADALKEKAAAGDPAAA